MIRISILLALIALLQACHRGQNVSVTIHVQGEEASTARFQSFEEASKWISHSCEPLWHQAKSKGRSARFHVMTHGSELAGIIESPQFGFESPDGRSMRLIQFVETYGDSPKIEGVDLQWNSVERYIKDEMMMSRVYGVHNQKPGEKQ